MTRFVPCLVRSVEGSELRSIALRHPGLDDYLEFVGARGAVNTWLATAYDLKVLHEVVGKEPAEVTAADVFAFLAPQRSPRRGERVVRIEDGEAGLAARTCANKTPSTFDQDYMKWADSAGVSYLAWGWIVLSQAERDATGCSAYYLINDYSTYAPAQPNGVAVHDHLRALASSGTAPPTPTPTTPGSAGGTGKPPVTLKVFRAHVMAGGSAVAFLLRSAQNCRGTLTGQTANAYAAVNRKRRKISLGTVHFKLKAAKSKTVVLKLSKASRKLLAGKGSLKVHITITLTSARHRRTVIHRTIILKASARHPRTH